MASRPSIRRRRLVAALTQLRKQSGKTLAEAANAAGWDTSKLSRIERFQVTITGDDTLTLCEALGASRTTSQTLAQLARESRRRGWWTVYADVLGTLEDFVELEADAKKVMGWESSIVPGSVQTEAYARAVIRNAWPEDPQESIDQRVQLRMERQKRMWDGPARLWVVVDEAALMRPVGGREVMAEQLDRLVDVSQKGLATVQVLPTELPGHAALGTTFTLIELQDDTRVVYVDTLTGGVYIEEPADVEHHYTSWQRLTAESLDFVRTRRMLGKWIAEHRRRADE
jgi:transcriptional regulator with XRE-family HTH domain